MARQFGLTWWGGAWSGALQEVVSADATRLSRGRTYARQGRVGLPEILPGMVRAEVTGKEEYVADLTIELIPDSHWAQLVNLIAGRSSHAAALLSGELPIELRDQAQEIGVELLPMPGQVRFDCTCPDWGDPCKHSAALAYLLADAIDADPFVLLLLRGRGRSELMDEVRLRRSAISAGSATPGKVKAGSKRGAGETIGNGVQAFGAQTVPASSYKAKVSLVIPRAIEPPVVHGAAVALGAPTPIDSGLRLSELEALVEDAAHRATRVLHQEASTGLDLDYEADLARRAANSLGGLSASLSGTSIPSAQARVSESLVGLSENSGVDVNSLIVRAIAWEYGELAGLLVSTQEWEPSVSQLAEARMLVGPRSRVLANSVSGNGMQLRLDKAGNWWRFRPDQELGWVLASPGFADPSELIDH